MVSDITVVFAAAATVTRAVANGPAVHEAGDITRPISDIPKIVGAGADSKRSVRRYVAGLVTDFAAVGQAGLEAVTRTVPNVADVVEACPDAVTGVIADTGSEASAGVL